MVTPIILFSDYKDAANTTNTGAALKTRIRELIDNVSQLVQDETNRRFDHRYETVYHDSRLNDRGGDVSEDGLLILRDDLINVDTLINDHTVTVSPQDYALLPLEQSADCKVFIKLRNRLVWRSSTVDTFDAIQVSGWWGYGGSWRPQTSLSGDVTDSGAVLTVAAHAGLEKGQLIRIGGEYMLITADPTSSAVSVERGYNGTEATAHSIGATLFVFRAHPTARRLVNRICRWQSGLDDSPLYGTVTIGDFEQPVNLSAMPQDVKAMIESLTRPLPIGAA